MVLPLYLGRWHCLRGWGHPDLYLMARRLSMQQGTGSGKGAYVKATVSMLAAAYPKEATKKNMGGGWERRVGVRVKTA